MKRQPLPMISCDDKPCGACCMDMDHFPVANYAMLQREKPSEAARLPQALREELEAGIDVVMRPEYRGDQPCMWLDLETRRCKHYEYRPDACRFAVVPGDEACRRQRRRLGIDATARYSLVRGKVVTR